MFLLYMYYLQADFLCIAVCVVPRHLGTDPFVENSTGTVSTPRNFQFSLTLYQALDLYNPWLFLIIVFRVFTQRYVYI